MVCQKLFQDKMSQEDVQVLILMLDIMIDDLNTAQVVHGLYFVKRSMSKSAITSHAFIHFMLGILILHLESIIEKVFNCRTSNWV